jgi:hypothetical protein
MTEASGEPTLHLKQHRRDTIAEEGTAVADVLDLELGPDVHAAIAALLEDLRGRKWCCGCCSASAARRPPTAPATSSMPAPPRRD